MIFFYYLSVMHTFIYTGKILFPYFIIFLKALPILGIIRYIRIVAIGKSYHIVVNTIFEHTNTSINFYPWRWLNPIDAHVAKYREGGITPLQNDCRYWFFILEPSSTRNQCSWFWRRLSF